ncbi:MULTISPECIES: hypothetical protein [Thalassospira]|jgi:hypothetical protein|uniref:hypothetical protein n=1 Tax=Thalassospira TaxID=168934 RepID=UPI003AA9AC63|tara:strand:- start:23306 stop:23668 length:363 start_codon:yes stop_codon:yes gene_type:complete
MKHLVKKKLFNDVRYATSEITYWLAALVRSSLQAIRFVSAIGVLVLLLAAAYEPVLTIKFFQELGSASALQIGNLGQALWTLLLTIWALSIGVNITFGALCRKITPSHMPIGSSKEGDAS